MGKRGNKSLGWEQHRSELNKINIFYYKFGGEGTWTCLFKKMNKEKKGKMGKKDKIFGNAITITVFRIRIIL